jgi:hypothetical protein
MGRRHTITFEEMTENLNQEIWSIAASSSGMGASKKLEVSTKGMFRVTTHGEVTYSGASLGMAVDAYNVAP